MSEFYKSVFYISNPEYGPGLLGNCWYFAVTPFPKRPFGVTTSNKIFSEINEQEINETVDVFNPLNHQKDNFKLKGIPNPNFSAHTFLVIIEISEENQSLIPILCEKYKDYFSEPRPVFFSIFLIVNDTIKFPMITNDGKSLTISTWSDISTSFEILQESVYFNMIKMKELFFQYLNEIQYINENCHLCNNKNISLSMILKNLFFFLKSLRNPVWIVVSNISVEIPKSEENQRKKNDEIEEIANGFVNSSMNCEFYVVGKKNYEQLKTFILKCNCPVNFFCKSQFNNLANELVYNILKPHIYFTRMDILYTNYFDVQKIICNGIQIDNYTFKFSTLPTDNTIHVFVRPDLKKMQKLIDCNSLDTPKILFRFRYIDANMNCFMRYIPIPCKNKKTFPEALLSLALTKILHMNYSVDDAINELSRYDISNYDYLNQKRFRFAIKSLNRISRQNNFYFSSFFLMNDPGTIFQFLSPIYTQVLNTDKFSSWDTTEEKNFGDILSIIQLYDHNFIFVEARNEIESNNQITWNQAKSIIAKIDSKGKFEIIPYDQFCHSSEWNVNLYRFICIS